MTTNIPPIQPAPQRPNRTLWIIFGIVGGLVGLVCVCGIAGFFVLNSLGTQVNNVFTEISTSIAADLAPTETSSSSGDLDTPTEDEAPTDNTDTSSAEETPTDDETPTDSAGGSSSVSDDGKTKVFTSSDGRSQVTAPTDWRTMTDLNSSAEIQIGAAFAEEYLVVLTESESDSTGYTLEEYATTIRDNFTKSVDNTLIGAPANLTINGLPAIQYEIRGTADDIDIVYWLTAIQGEKNLFQVVGWTLADEVDTHRDEILGVVSSFEQP